MMTDSPFTDAEQLGRLYESMRVSATDRRKYGVHYTPQTLAGEIVRATLEPLCRQKNRDEILALRICDPAMGCGIFLVEACRWLAERLMQADPAIDHDKAMRLIAQKCLYGVDIDPGAIEVAKKCVAANFRCGDSLIGDAAIFPEIFNPQKEPGTKRSAVPGFDAIIGNPPFLGGRKMRGALGDEYLKRLLAIWPHASLNADLSAFFFLRAAMLVNDRGTIGFLAPDAIAQGDTARTGLLHLVTHQGFTIRHAQSSFRWPGKATVRAAWTVLQKGEWHGPVILNGKSVKRISPILDTEFFENTGISWNQSVTIPENREINFQGSVLAGRGFVLTDEEAEHCLNLRHENREVVFPFLGGSDVQTHPQYMPRRWAIDFRDYSLEYCETRWPELLTRIRQLVKPLRDKANRPAHRRNWWHHGDKRPALYGRVRRKQKVFVLVRHAKFLALALVPTQYVFQESLCILDLPNWSAFAVIQSTIHYLWAKRGSSTLGDGLRYTPSDYFDTFPFLHLESDELEAIGRQYYDARQTIMTARNEGLTKLYNRFHSPDEQDICVKNLQELRRQMDEAVARAYGWDDLALDHGFYELQEGIRFTINESARSEILRRLLWITQ